LYCRWGIDELTMDEIICITNRHWLMMVLTNGND
jgi:hypothetical protein